MYDAKFGDTSRIEAELLRTTGKNDGPYS